MSCSECHWKLSVLRVRLGSLPRIPAGKRSDLQFCPGLWPSEHTDRPHEEEHGIWNLGVQAEREGGALRGHTYKCAVVHLQIPDRLQVAQYLGTAEAFMFPSRGRMKMSGILAVSFIQLAGKQKEFTQISYPLRHDPEEEANRPPRILAQPHPKGLTFRKGSHCSRTFRVVVLAWSQVPVKIEPGPAKICFYGY